jgi:hypothetical protein
MQDLFAILLALAAAAFLARRAWQRLTHRRAAACGSCSHCASPHSPQAPQLVSISPIISHAKAPSREEVGT